MSVCWSFGVHSDLGVVQVLVQLERAEVPVPDDGGRLDLLQPGEHEVNNCRKGPTGMSIWRSRLTFCQQAGAPG